MSITTVLFDLDGTLIDTRDLILKSFAHTFEQVLQKSIPEDELLLHFGRPLVYTMQTYGPDRTTELLQTYREFNHSHHDELTKEFPMVRATLAELKQRGYRLGIVTSKIRRVAVMGLKLFDLDGLMEILVFEEDTEKHKPEPEPVLKALELARVEPTEALYVGDSPYDILCGQRAGVKTAAALWTSYAHEKLLKLKPDYALESITDLLEHLPPR